jgi:hypothetical protein
METLTLILFASQPIPILGRFTFGTTPTLTNRKNLFVAYHVPVFALSRARRAAKRRYINQWGTKKVVCLRVLGPVVRALPYFSM